MPEETCVCCGCARRHSSHQTGTSTPLVAEGLSCLMRVVPFTCRMAPFSGRSSQPDACTRRRAAAACTIAAVPAITGLQHTRMPSALLPGALLCRTLNRCAGPYVTVAQLRQTVRHVLLHTLRQRSACLLHLVPPPSGTLQQQHSCHGNRRSTASWQQQRTARTQHAAFR